MSNPKYKAWDTKRKKMWSAEEMGRDQLTLSPDGKGFINVSSVSIKLSQYLPHLIPLQYTGRDDNGGMEIYAEDIVCADGITAVVTWNKRFTGFELAATGNRLGFFSDIKVVGNKYENPEMRKKAIE